MAEDSEDGELSRNSGKKNYLHGFDEEVHVVKVFGEKVSEEKWVDDE